MRLMIIALLGFVIAGCATPPIMGHPSAKTVKIDGEQVWVAKFEDGSWGATRYALAPIGGPSPATETALLTRAIEAVSGCKVVTPAYDVRQLNLFATVKC